MKKIKKLVVLLTAFAVVLGMSSSAFAYTPLPDDGDRSTQQEGNGHVVYSTIGMLRIVDEGTSVSVSEDGETLKIKATTSSSKTWGKITKLAFCEQEAAAAEKNKAAEGIKFEDASYSDTAVNRVISFEIPSSELGMMIPVCRYQSDAEGGGEWTDFSAQQYYIVLKTDELEKEILTNKLAAAEKAKKDAEAKAAAAEKARKDAEAKASAAEKAKAEAEAKAAAAEKKAAAKISKPAKVSIKKVKRGKKKVTVTWKKVSKNVTGYEIVVKDKNGMTKTVTAKKSATKKVVSKLKKGKYTVKVRAFNKANGAIAYGTWSKGKTVRVK